MNEYIEQVVDLTDPSENQLYDLTTDQARLVLLEQTADCMLQVQGSFALVARAGKTVRLARSIDRPMRYFLAKRKDGPVLIVAARIDAIYDYLKSEGLHEQFHPSYTRMVPAHYVTELQLVGCPDPDPVYTRFLLQRWERFLKTPSRSAGDTSGLQLMRFRSGSIVFLRKSRLGSAFPAASTAEASSSSPIT